jgi:glycosyltransferase involved in cell wall biosynthesis/predicted SAM-dependent methyltransferase
MPLSETSKIRARLWPWVRTGKGLDLGCGSDKIHPCCTGIDRIAAPGVDVVGDIRDLSSFSVEEFDWVYSSHALEDIEDTDAALREWLRVLRPDGHILIYAPYRHYYPNRGTPGSNPNHVHDFVPGDILAALRRCHPSIWIVTAELRGYPRQDEFHEYSFLIIARKNRVTSPRVLIQNNLQVGDTLSIGPLSILLRKRFPEVLITVAGDTERVLDSRLADRVGEADEPYDLIVNQRTNATEFGDWLRRTTHFTQFTARVCAELLPEIAEDLPADPAEPLDLIFSLRDEDFWPEEIEAGFVAVSMETHAPRSWPHDRWQRLIRWLLDEGHRVVVIGRDSSASVDERAVDLRGRTTLRQAASILAKSRLLVSVDSVMAHLAHWAHVPAVVLMGPSSAPLTLYSDTIPVWRSDGGCIGCYNWASEQVPWQWRDGSPVLPVGEPRRETRQLGLYIQPGCSDFQRGVECTEAIRFGDVAARVGGVLQAEVERIPGLTVTYIVRNESHHIGRSLDSLVGLADAVVLVDTGSVDDTTDVARAWAARTGIDLQVSSFQWIDDFAAARNAALDRVRTKHFMWLDADEMVEDPRGLKRAFETTRHDAYYMVTDMGTMSFHRERIALVEGTRWLYPVHECLDIQGLRSVRTPFRVLHRPLEHASRNGALARNRAIIEAWLEREPDCDRALFYMGETLRQAGDWLRACDYYGRHHRQGTDWHEARFQSAYQIARFHLSRGEWHEAARWGLEAIRCDPVWRDGYYAVGDAYFWLGLYEVAQAWFLAAHALPLPDRMLWREEAIYGHLCETQLSYCCERLGRLEEAIAWAARAAELGGPTERVAELRRIMIESRLSEAGVKARE